MKITDLKTYTVTDSSKAKTTTSQPSPVQPTAPKVPLLTKETGSFASNVGTGIKDIAVGAGKSFLEGARGVAQIGQGIGKATLGAFGADTSQMGFKSVDNSTPEGARVADVLKSNSRGEQVGKVLGTVADVGVGFVKSGAQAALKAKQATNLAQRAEKVKGAFNDLEPEVSLPITKKNVEYAEKVTKDNNKVFETITPKTSELTPTEYQDLLAKGKITPKTLKEPSQYVLSDSEKQIALKNRHLLTSSDPVQNSINIMNDIASKDTQVGAFLRRNNGIYSKGELQNSILEKMKDISDITVDEGRLEKLKQTMAEGFTRALKKNDMESLWNARKAFDTSIEKVFNGSPTLQNTVKKEFRNAIQDFIAEKTPAGVYKGYMKDMRELFNLQDIVATKATKEKSLNRLQLWAKNNPTKVKVLGALSGGGAVLGIGSSLLGD